MAYVLMDASESKVTTSLLSLLDDAPVGKVTTSLLSLLDGALVGAFSSPFPGLMTTPLKAESSLRSSAAKLMPYDDLSAQELKQR